MTANRTKTSNITFRIVQALFAMATLYAGKAITDSIDFELRDTFFQGTELYYYMTLWTKYEAVFMLAIMTLAISVRSGAVVWLFAVLAISTFVALGFGMTAVGDVWLTLAFLGGVSLILGLIIFLFLYLIRRGELRPL